jgi:2-polyprenyl-6-hydroxyphenyl methylase/3-demethylubiquinone-9 3-methyltransferase
LEFPVAPKIQSVNNAFYDDLGERWFKAQDDPVALLRAEGEVKNAWVESQLRKRWDPGFPGSNRVLDLGCGAGFLANRLAISGYEALGIDQSFGSLRMARQAGGTARFQQGDALRLPFGDRSFNAVCAMDFLEHVEQPGAVIAEASRVLRPGGLFFFHTFNRNLLAWAVAIRGVDWFVRNTPPHMHVLRLFLKPRELEAYCRESGMTVREWTGIRPDWMRSAFWRLLATGVVPEDFRFRLTPSRLLSYMGVAEKAGRESRYSRDSTVSRP